MSNSNELSSTVHEQSPDDRHYVSIGYAATVLNTDSAGVIDLLNRGIIDADADITGDVILFKMSALLDASKKMRGEE